MPRNRADRHASLSKMVGKIGFSHSSKHNGGVLPNLRPKGTSPPAVMPDQGRGVSKVGAVRIWRDDKKTAVEPMDQLLAKLQAKFRKGG